MLKKTFKLNSLELKKLFTNPKNTSKQVFRSDFFDLKIFPNPETEHCKFAVILTSKQFKRAVLRNKIKRQFYTLVENFLQENKILKPEKFFIIFYPKINILTLKFSEIQIKVYNELTKILK